MPELYGGMEAGGTKWVCAVGTGPDALLAETRFPTTTPGPTISQAIDFFKEQTEQHGPLAAIGVGSFGPVDPDPRSPGYGRITTTPKPGWANTDVAGPLGEALNAPVAFDTDVDAAALAEARWGCAQGLDNFLYLTIGTGIGGGAIVEGHILHGLIHPEMGHILIPHDFEVDPFAGICPFHKDCLEGLASGPAIQARWGEPAENLPLEHPAWELESTYLALALADFVCILSPERIALGGGVMKQRQLFPKVRAKLQAALNGYIQVPETLEEIDSYIVPPALGDRAGVLGAIAMARQIIES